MADLRKLRHGETPTDKDWEAMRKEVERLGNIKGGPRVRVSRGAAGTVVNVDDQTLPERTFFLWELELS